MDDRRIKSVLPNAELILAMPPAELAKYLLADLNWQADHAGTNSQFHVGNYARSLGEAECPYEGDALRQVQNALMEAWAWLISQAMLAHNEHISGSASTYVLTREARAIRTEEDFERFRTARQFPVELLHPRIAERAWLPFLNGRLETAVFESFREVEIAVREAAGLTEADYGVVLMRKAFHPERGPLREESQQPGERQALMEMFSGAIGSYKNPHSHRLLPIDDPAEAAEMIMHASHLMRIVEARAAPVNGLT